MKRWYFKLCLVTVMIIGIICSIMPVRALCVVKTEKLSVLETWNGQPVASEVYSVERLPVKSKEITSDRVSRQSFVEQIKSEQPYEENCILVTIAHEYSIPNQLFGIQSFPELEAISVEDLTHFDNLCNDDVVELINPNEFRQILKIKLKPVGEDTVPRAIAALENRPEIRYVGPNYIYEWEATTAPNEFITMSTQEQGALNLIDAPLAWEVTTGTSATKIGILDDGFYDHPDYRANRVETKNYSVFPPTDDVEDPDSYHGTHIAGVIGAEGNNGIGTTGVCWDVSMYFVKYVTIERKTNGQKSYSSDTDNIAQAFTWFEDNGVSVVNWSWTRGTDQQLQDAIANYYGLLCVPAGNNGSNIGEHNAMGTLARLPYDNMLCVAALNAAGTGLATHDDWNEKYASSYNVESVDLAAPGTYTYTTTGTNGYNLLQIGGTSCATAYVTGVAALIKSRYPDLTATQIKAAIMEGVTPVAALSGKCVTGGRLNAKGALDKAALMAAPTILTGDFNGDGREDLALFESYPSADTAIRVRLASEDEDDIPVYSAVTTWWRSGAGVFDMSWVEDRLTAGDFDGDNQDEIAVFYGYADNRMNLIVFDPQDNNTFQKAVWKSYPAGSWEAFRLNGTITSGNFASNTGNIGKDEIVGVYQYAAGNVKFFMWQFSTVNSTPTMGHTVCKEYAAGDFSTAWMQGLTTAGDINDDGYEEYMVGYGYSDYAFKILYYRYSATSSTFNSGMWYSAPAGSYDIECMRDRFVFVNFSDVAYKEIGIIYQRNNGNVDFILMNNTTNNRYLCQFTSAQYNASLCAHIDFGDTNGDEEKELIVVYEYPAAVYRLFGYTPSADCLVYD